jgi:polyisoprenoid-binding protein YceI
MNPCLETAMQKSARLVAALSLLAATTAAHAVEYDRLQPERSAVTFTFKQMGVPVEGSFKRLAGQVRFDPANPTAGRAEIEIDLAGVDVGSAEGNEELAGRLWFDTKRHPKARFVASAVEPQGAGHLAVTGQMTIKGTTKEIRVPAAFRVEAGNAVLEGSFVLRRADYAIGEGLWADFGTVANEVELRFRLTASAAGRP